MNQYKGLSYIYDYLVSGVDFNGWIDYVESLMQRFNLSSQSVADIACGTGNTVIPFAIRGYQCIGVDLSDEMLDLARKKSAEQNLAITFIQQDMRYLRLPDQVSLITCFHDGLNYLLDIQDIQKTFNQVYKNLSHGGAFIFDLNAVNWLSGSKNNEVTVVEDRDLTLIWETDYNKQQDIWRIKLTGFIREGDLYRKFSETHSEKAYHPAQITSCLEAAGFALLGAFDAFSFEPVKQGSIRHFYVAQKIVTE